MSFALVPAFGGCSLFQKKELQPPEIVSYVPNVDPVHVRQHSAANAKANRGGAALRKEGCTNVLWSAHYDADSLKTVASV